MSLPKIIFINPLKSLAGGCNFVQSYDATNIKVNEKQIEFMQIVDHKVKVQHLEGTISNLEDKLKVATEALKFYADRMNYSVDYDTSQMVTRRVILYSDQEEINEATIVAGRKAREALKKMEDKNER